MKTNISRKGKKLVATHGKLSMLSIAGRLAMWSEDLAQLDGLSRSASVQEIEEEFGLPKYSFAQYLATLKG